MKNTSFTLSAILSLMVFLGGCKNDDPLKITPADEMPPTVTIAYPYDNALVSGVMTVRVLATDDKGIKKVVLFIDGLPVADGEASTEPYEIPWNTLEYEDSTTHVIIARAIDIGDNITDSDPVICMVDNHGLYPSLIRLYPIDYREGSFHISWQQSPDRDFFEYLLFESSDAQLADEQEIFSSRTVSDTSFVVTDIPEGETRYYRVRVENEVGLVSFSNISSATANQDLPDGLKAYYPFNGTAEDETGSGHDGQAINAELTADRNGNPASAYHFDGTAYIEINDHNDIVFPDGFTLAAWIKPEMALEHNNIISKVSPNRDFVMQLNASNLLNAHFYVDPAFYHLYSTDPVLLDEWTHVAYVFDDLTMKLYVNGDFVSERPVAESPVWTGEVMLIGAMNYTENFIGSIDEVMIFGRALDDSEIQQLTMNNAQ